MITIIGMDDFPTQIAVFPFLLSDGNLAIAATHATTPGTSEIAYSAAYLVDSVGRATKVGQSEPYGKDIACAVTIIGNVARLFVTEAQPGGGGATARLDWYDFPIVSSFVLADAWARAQVTALDARLDKIALAAQG